MLGLWPDGGIAVQSESSVSPVKVLCVAESNESAEANAQNKNIKWLNNFAQWSMNPHCTPTTGSECVQETW